MFRRFRSLVIATLLLVQAPAWAAKCVVTEHRALPRDATGQVMQVPAFPPVRTQAVNFTSSSQSDPFSDATYYIGIVCNATAHFVVGSNPTATADSPWITTDTWLFLEVPPGARIAFYDGQT